MNPCSHNTVAKSAGLDHQPRPLIVGLGGTFREESSTGKALDLALAGAERLGADIVRFGSSKLSMPLYNPEELRRSPVSEELISLFERCDGVIVASPSYHGSISGVIKNALDYAEDMIGRGVPYLEDKAIGCIGCGAGWQGAVGALSTLRSIAHSLRAWPTPLGVVVNTSQQVFTADGRCLDRNLSEQLDLVGRQVVSFALARRFFVENNRGLTEAAIARGSG